VRAEDANEKYIREQQRMLDAVTKHFNPMSEHFHEEQKMIDRINNLYPDLPETPTQQFETARMAQELQANALLSDFKRDWGIPAIEIAQQLEDALRVSQLISDPLRDVGLKLNSLLNDVRPAILENPLTYGNIWYNIDNDIEIDDDVLNKPSNVDEGEISACYDLIRSARNAIKQNDQLDSEQEEKAVSQIELFPAKAEAFTQRPTVADTLKHIKFVMILASATVGIASIYQPVSPEIMIAVTAINGAVDMLEIWLSTEVSKPQNRDNILDTQFAAANNGLPEGIDNDDIGLVKKVIDEDENKK